MTIEPGTSPKHRYELIKATLLVIVGALITITIVYGIPYFSPKEVADPIEPVATNPEAKPTPMVGDTDDKVIIGDKIYTSDKLGLSFKYPITIKAGQQPWINSDSIYDTVTEKDNNIYISVKKLSSPPKDDEYYIAFEVFNKNSKDSLRQALNKDFLSNATNQCFISDDIRGDDSFTTAKIDFDNIFKSDDSLPELPGGICPKKAEPYVNLSSFFLTDKQQKSSHYISFKEGHESFVWPDSWLKTIQFLK
jgi:hypothetical protein